MSTFIKAGLWTKKKLGFKGELNLTQLIESLIPPPTPTLPYKSYVAFISQSGTNPPTVSKLFENTLGVTISYEYVSVGVYNIKATANGFTTNKTFFTIAPGSRPSNSYSVPYIGFDVVNNQTITINTYASNGINPTNGLLRNVPIEIRVYN